ncbi:MAG: ribosome recycling factor, partial [Dehalococcoidia bacterium]
MMDEVLADVEQRMNSTLDALRKDLASIRAGRASLAILDGVKVDYYGTETPLSQVATLSIPEPSLIVAQPWDPSVIEELEKAVRRADLGLNPSNDGKVVRIPIPPLTEERRKQLARKVGQVGEECKTALRQVRRDGNERLKALEKGKDISQDE